jgi:hypothetical protein
VGSFDHAAGYGNTLLEVKVNPRDVVSVPSDTGGAKMRVCRYTVVQEITGKYEEAVKAAEPATAEAKAKGKTAAQKVLGALRRGKGKDAAAIAAATDLQLHTARTTLSRLQRDGKVKKVGTKGKSSLWGRA